jgi:hypothetical protein
MQRERWDNDRVNGFVRLIAAAVVIAAVWLLLLPQVGKKAAIRQYIARNEAQGIDPSAKFYTELPGMTAIWAKMEGVKRREERAFW